MSCVYSTLWVATSNTRRTCGSVAMRVSAWTMPSSISASGSSTPLALEALGPASSGRMTRSIMALNKSALSLKCQ
ncbi:Uncharacterised protein [Mycobacterium tuberculosis]|nr:Uncharacterised protein [Mycobacterium tuberculosis]